MKLELFRQTLLLGGLLSLAGCEAVLGGQEPGDAPVTGPGTAADQGSSDAPAALAELNDIDCSAAPVDPGERPLRLLSRLQYENTMSALFGEVPGLGEALATSVAPSTLGVPQALINGNDVEGFARAAELVAAHVAGDETRLGTLAPCAADEEQALCVRSFLENFGARAYRAPLRDEEDIAAHLALFEVGASTSYARGIELLLRGMLQSPRFLYQVEVGTSSFVGAHAVELRPLEMAARLSFAIWNTIPDEALINAAEAGDLATEAGVVAQVERMTKDPRGASFIVAFLEEWTHLRRVKSLAKNTELYPEWDSIRDATHDQGRAFFEQIVHQEGATLRALLTSPTVLVNDVLAPHYGASTGEDFVPIQDPPGTPSGLLTLPALLATLAKLDETSPIHRGVFIREALLCQSPPAPPAQIPQPPSVDSGGSTRERLAQHVAEPACAGCHELFDPVGLGLESYDAIGLFRELDGGKPVDATGEVSDTDVDGPFDGPVELGAKLADSELVEQCVARQWFRYAMGRIEQEADLCSIKRLVGDFVDSEQKLTALPEAVARTDAFRLRRPSDAEIAP